MLIFARHPFLDFDSTPTSPNASYAERQAYRVALGLPGPVDRWLTSNIRSNRVAFLKDYLMLIDVNGIDCVECCVQVACVKTPANRDNFEQPNIWTLYLTATAPPRTGSGQAVTTSPCAILERYTGSNTAIDAPEWTLWNRPVEKFQQPRAAFGVLFTRMALWKDNRDQPQLAYDMVKWARSIAAPPLSLLQKLQPATPPPSSPKTVQNVRVRKARPTSSNQQAADEATPTRTLRSGARNLV
ncbi:hypothetical protein FIBSPDRAFT_958786 [Athelia psychrophila]|uniref:Uncharacterized protein n=1 Tax=Athelia psychrophila TaxID=1759441 RepID=A0A166E6R3_9AGAM|nr:hypothetical protein FIBSPDRAFT_958786 [Fibularhizoctonia sp. CBS 109695]